MKKYIHIVLYIGILLCIIALFTPAAYFENVVWNHKIINWIWGLFQDTFNETVTGGFYNESLQLIPSIIASTLIVLSILIVGIGSIKYKNDLKKGSIKLFIYIIPAICILSSIIFWMVMMEIAEQEIYDISMWGRYVLGFGVIGLIIGASFIILGSLLIKYVKVR